MNTHLYRRGRIGLGLLALFFSGLGTSCQTAKEAYSFQPMPHSVVAAQPVPRQGGPPPSEAAPAAAAEQVAPGKLPVGPPKPQHRRGLRQNPRPVASVFTRGGAVATLRHPWRHQPRQSPQAPAEQGLGLTVLGLLGMVAVVVGLVGVVVGGGAAWAIIAGVGAVVVLLAYLIPRAQQ